MAEKSNLVRYQVVGKCFVNGVRYDPAKSPGGKPVFVTAPPGLEGKALKLASAEKPAKKPAGNGDKAKADNAGNGDTAQS